MWLGQAQRDECDTLSRSRAILGRANVTDVTSLKTRSWVNSVKSSKSTERMRMNEAINVSRPASRRGIRDPRMLGRVNAEVPRVASDVHRRRLLNWARCGSGDYPALVESVRIAKVELSVLAAAMGSLVEIEPSQFDADIRVVKRGTA